MEELSYTKQATTNPNEIEQITTSTLPINQAIFKSTNQSDNSVSSNNNNQANLHANKPINNLNNIFKPIFTESQKVYPVKKDGAKSNSIGNEPIISNMIANKSIRYEERFLFLAFFYFYYFCFC